MSEKEHIEVMLKHLKMSLAKARMFSDLADLRYDPDKEEVTATFYGFMKEDHTRTTYEKQINVACDSNGAMIYDVVKTLYEFCR